MATNDSKREIEGWKSIAGYLKISTQTAIRYANLGELNMPVRKQGIGQFARVIAFADELDTWWKDVVLRPRKPKISQK